MNKGNDLYKGEELKMTKHAFTGQQQCGVMQSDTKLPYCNHPKGYYFPTLEISIPLIACYLFIYLSD